MSKKSKDLHEFSKITKQALTMEGEDFLLGEIGTRFWGFVEGLSEKIEKDYLIRRPHPPPSIEIDQKMCYICDIPENQISKKRERQYMFVSVNLSTRTGKNEEKRGFKKKKINICGSENTEDRYYQRGEYKIPQITVTARFYYNKLGKKSERFVSEKEIIVNPFEIPTKNLKENTITDFEDNLNDQILHEFGTAMLDSRSRYVEEHIHGN